MPFLDVGDEPYRGIGAPYHQLLDQAIDRRTGFMSNKIPAANPKLTDAVIAAVKVMSKLDETPTSIMGAPEEAQEIHRLIKATNQDVQRWKVNLGSTEVVRWGLFVDEWLRYREEVGVNTAALDRLPDFKKRAIEWATKISALVKQQPGYKPADANSIKTNPKIPWKRVWLVVGFGVVLFAGAKIYQSTRQEG